MLQEILLNSINTILEMLSKWLVSEYDQFLYRLTDFTGPGYVWLYILIAIKIYRKFYL